MKRYRIRDMTKHIIITMPSSDIYKQSKIIKGLFNVTKSTQESQKRHTPNLVHQTINIDDNINVNHKSQ